MVNSSTSNTSSTSPSSLYKPRIMSVGEYNKIMSTPVDNSKVKANQDRTEYQILSSVKRDYDISTFLAQTNQVAPNNIIPFLRVISPSSHHASSPYPANKDKPYSTSSNTISFPAPYSSSSSNNPYSLNNSSAYPQQQTDYTAA